jgi:hypothetical protein
VRLQTAVPSDELTPLIWINMAAMHPVIISMETSFGAMVLVMVEDYLVLELMKNSSLFFFFFFFGNYECLN